VLLVQDFPKLGSWMEWWAHPVHASMLFELERKMDMELWKSLPPTNNPEEAKHWKLHCACGRDHKFLKECIPYMLLPSIMSVFMRLL